MEKRKRRSLEQIKADIDARLESKKTSASARACLEEAQRAVRSGELTHALEVAKQSVTEIERLIERTAQSKREQDLRSPHLSIPL